jgi:hypothetical protein
MTSGEWNLSASSDLTSTHVRDGLSALDDDLRGGPTQRIAASLMTMVAVTRRPAAMDDDRAKLYFQTIQDAMMDYPVDVVEDALAEWRKGPQGEWWPAEAELRRVCEKLFAPRKSLRLHAAQLLIDLEREEERQERANRPSMFSGNRQRAFSDEMRKRMGDRFDAYFDPAYIRYQGEREILVNSQVSEAVLLREGGDLIREWGLSVRHAPQEFIGAKPVEVHMTQEDHDRVAAGMTTLANAMKLGVNVRALKEAGKL